MVVFHSTIHGANVTILIYINNFFGKKMKCKCHFLAYCSDFVPKNTKIVSKYFADSRKMSIFAR